MVVGYVLSREKKMKIRTTVKSTVSEVFPTTLTKDTKLGPLICECVIPLCIETALNHGENDILRQVKRKVLYDQNF